MNGRMQKLVTALIIVATVAVGLLSAVWLKHKAAALFTWRGYSHYAQEDWDKVIHDMTIAIRLNPNNAANYRYRAYAYEMKGETDKAIQDYSEVIRLEPKDAWARQNRGSLYMGKPDYDHALQDFNAAIQLDPLNTECRCSRGAAYLGMHDWDKALEDFNAALRQEPSNTYARVSRGYAYEMKGETAKALEDIKEALREDPEDAGANNSLAWVRATCPDDTARDGVEAIRLATKACMRTEWKNSSYLDTLAAAYAETGDFDNAVRYQERALAQKDLPPENTRQEMQDRLKLYQDRKPYRDVIKLEKQ